MNKLSKELGVCKTDTFSEAYPLINSMILDEDKWDESRDGEVKEILNFKTIIDNPYRRCVGGAYRNINIFFLMAESMWIFTGQKDVKFLNFFNKQMKTYSDDGNVFHAPYGFRLRHYGVRSEDKYSEDNLHAAQGYDQVSDAIKIFAANPNTRQVVLSIWNPDFDLGAKSKDIPCNDILMLKIRDNKLVTTIQNRSNDLHWGLPTNVFQFSFLTEMISSCLGIKLGTQVHNSQSLHVYKWNDVAFRMNDIYKHSTDKNSEFKELYSVGAKERAVDFKFSHEVPGNRLRELDFMINVIIFNLTNIANGKEEVKEEINQLAEFSSYLYRSYLYLKVYLNYKHVINDNKDAKTSAAREAIKAIEEIDGETWSDWDISILAKNFFAKKIEGFEHNFLGKL